MTERTYLDPRFPMVKIIATLSDEALARAVLGTIEVMLGRGGPRELVLEQVTTIVSDIRAAERLRMGKGLPDK